MARGFIFQARVFYRIQASMTRLLDFAACLPQCPACPKAKGHAKCLPAPKKHSAALELQKFRCLPACLNRLCRAHLPSPAFGRPFSVKRTRLICPPGDRSPRISSLKCEKCANQRRFLRELALKSCENSQANRPSWVKSVRV